MKIFFIVLFLFLFLIGCGGRQVGDSIVIYQVDSDEFKLTSKYFFMAGNGLLMCHFIDKYGMYSVGDTIFSSSLRQKN